MSKFTKQNVAVVVLLGAAAGWSWFNWRSRPVPPLPAPATANALDWAAAAWRTGVAKSMFACADMCDAGEVTDVEAQKFLAQRFKDDLAAATVPIMQELSKSVVLDESGNRTWSRAEFSRILRELAK